MLRSSNNSINKVKKEETIRIFDHNLDESTQKIVLASQVSLVLSNPAIDEEEQAEKAEQDYMEMGNSLAK